MKTPSGHKLISYFNPNSVLKNCIRNSEDVFKGCSEDFQKFIFLFFEKNPSYWAQIGFAEMVSYWKQRKILTNFFNAFWKLKCTFVCFLVYFYLIISVIKNFAEFLNILSNIGFSTI